MILTSRSPAASSRRTLRTALHLSIATAALSSANSALAATDTWLDTDGLFWSNTAGWLSGVLPANGDIVNIGTHSSAVSSPTLNFTPNLTTSGTILSSLDINSTGVGGTMILSQALSTSAMNAVTEIIGDTIGANLYTQNAGSNTATSITIGNGSGGGGSYTLSGSGTVSVGTFTVGNAGFGTVNQSGGTVSISSALAIGQTGTSSSGTYNLSVGNVTLSSGATFTIGATRGSFAQSGGTVNFLGSNGITLLNASIAGNTNSYALSGTGQITNVAFESIGSSSIGNAATFTQSGTSNNTFAAGGILTVGNTGAALYSLNSGSLTVANTVIGSAATGTFTQAGGNWSANNIDLGVLAGSTGAYNLNGGSVLLTGNLTAGEVGTAVITQTGGTITTTGLNSKIIVGNGASATYNLSSTGQINADEIDIGAFAGGNFTGTFNQSGGNIAISGNLVLGFASGATANYTLSSGILNAHFESIGFTGGSIDNFTQTSGLNSTLGLTVGVNSGSVASYTISNGTLAVGTLANPGNITVGLLTNTATMTQNAGNVTIAGTGGALSLGGNSGSAGTYLLKGGSLSSDSQFIGQLGNGTFNHNGGTNSLTGTGALGGLFVGYRGSGVYTLTGFGVQAILNTTSEYIGSFIDGTFFQGLNSTNTASTSIVVGANTGGTGTFNMNGGTLTSPLLSIGFLAPGTFTQTGGTVTVQTGLSVGGASSGVYSLTSGALVTPATINGFIVTPTGTFTQSGGSFNGYLLNQGTTIYNAGAFNGTLENAANAVVTLNASLTAGGGILNRGNISVGLGITLASGNTGLNQLDNEASLQLVSGALGGVAPILNNGSIAGFGTLGGSGGLTNNGIFTAAGTLILNNTGANANVGTIISPAGGALQIDSALTNTGSINLSGGTLRGAGTLANSLGGTIAGFGTFSVTTFNNTGGTLFAQGGTFRLINPITNAGIIQVAPGATLSGAAVSNTNSIQGAGTISNAVTNSGTIEPIGGTLLFAAPLANPAAGTINAAVGNKLLLAAGLPTNAGLINLSGGVFDNNNLPLNNTGSILGYGTFRTGGSGLTNSGSVLFAGGSTTVTGNVTNTATHTLEVRNTPAIFTGNIVNNLNATIKTTNTTATFAGSFTNNGFYISDPATNFFQGPVSTGTASSMSGSTGDVFTFAAAFTNTGTFANGGNLNVTGSVTNAGSFTQTGPQSWSATSGFTNTAGLATFGSNAKLANLTITAGTVNLTTSKFIIEPANKSATLLALQTDANNGSLTASGLAPNLALAIIDNGSLANPFTTFGGLPADSGSILIAPELLGDTNIDGRVDLTDLNTVLNHLGTPSTGWTWGGFDGQPTINLTDLNDVLNNLGVTYANSSSVIAAESLIAAFPTPEPASLCLVSFALPLFLRRRPARRFES